MGDRTPDIEAAVWTLSARKLEFAKASTNDEERSDADERRDAIDRKLGTLNE